MTEEKHVIGDKQCKSCCCHYECPEKNCDGVAHVKPVHDCPEEGWIHNIKCDKCDYEYKYYDDEKLGIEFV